MDSEQRFELMYRPFDRVQTAGTAQLITYNSPKPAKSHSIHVFKDLLKTLTNSFLIACRDCYKYFRPFKMRKLTLSFIYM